MMYMIILAKFSAFASNRLQEHLSCFNCKKDNTEKSFNYVNRLENKS